MRNRIFRFPLILTLCGFTLLLATAVSALTYIEDWQDGRAVSNTYVDPEVNFNYYSPVIPLSDGSVVAMWQDDRDPNDTVGIQVYMQKFNSMGVTQWAASGVQATDVGSFSQALVNRIDVDASDNIYFAWGNGSSIGGAESFVQKVDTNGNILWGANGSPASTENDNQNDVQVARNDNGGAYAAFRNYNVSPQQLQVQHLDSNGNMLWAANGLPVTTNPTKEASFYFGIAADGSGGVVIAWCDNLASELYLQRMDSSGNLLWGNDGVLISNQITSSDALLLQMQGSNSIVSWVDDNNGVVYAQKLNASGVAQWTPGGVVVSNVDGRSLTSLTVTSDGGAVIHWTIDTFAEYISKVNTAGSVVWPNTLLGNGATSDWFTADLHGGVYLVSENYGVNPSEVRLLQYNSSGSQIAGSGLLLNEGIYSNTSYGVSLGNNAIYTLTSPCFDNGCTAYTDFLVKKIIPQYQVANLNSNLNAIDNSNINVEVGSIAGKTGVAETLRLQDNDNNLLIAETIVNMTQDRDWSTVSGDSDITGKSVVANLNVAMGAAATFKLLVPKVGSTNAVYVCPNATTTVEITMACSGGYQVTNPTFMTLNGQDYFSVPDSVSGGAMSIVIASSSPPTPLTPVTSNITENILVVSPEQNGDLISGLLTFVWKPFANQDNVAQYQIFLVKVADSNQRPLDFPLDFVLPNYLLGVIDDPTVTSFTTTEILSPGSYRWQIIAVNNSGERIGDSGIVQFSISNDVVSAPVTSSSSQSSTQPSTPNKFVDSNIVATPSVISANTLPTLAPLAIAASAVAAVAIVSGNSFSGVIVGLFITRKRKSWGMVYDIKTNKPVPLAVIRLFNQQNNLVALAISDAKGLYGLLLDTLGVHTLRAEATGYQPYKLLLNLYTPDAVIDIPLAAASLKGNPVRNFYIKHYEEIISGLRFGLLLMLTVGLVYSMYATFQTTVTANYLIVGAYTLLVLPGIFLLVNPLINQVHGQVIDIQNHRGIPGVIVRFLSKTGQAMTMTNKSGLIKINLPVGEYTALAHKDGYELISDKQTALGMKLAKVHVDNHGGITEKIQMRKVGNTSNENLATPFGN
jgi:hypothetical protein